MLSYDKKVQDLMEQLTGENKIQRVTKMVGKTTKELTTPLKHDNLGTGAVNALLKYLETGDALQAGLSFLQETVNPVGMLFRYGTGVGRFIGSVKTGSYIGKAVRSGVDFYNNHRELIDLIRGPYGQMVFSWIQDNRETIATILNKVIEEGGEIFGEIPTLLDNISQHFPELDPKVTEIFEKAGLGDLKAAVDTFIANFLGTDKALEEVTKGTSLNPIAVWMTEHRDQLANAIQALADTYAQTGNLRSGIDAFMANFVENTTLTDLLRGTPLEPISVWMNEKSSGLREAVGVLISAYDQSGGDLKKATMQFLTEFADKETLNKLTAGTQYQDISAWVTDMYTNLGPVVKNAIAAYKSSGGDLKSAITSFAADVFTNPSALGFLMGNADFGKVLSLITNPAGTILSSLGVNAESPLTSMLTAAINSLTQNGGDVNKALTAAGMSLIGSLESPISSWFGGIDKLFRGDGLSTVAGALTTAIEDEEPAEPTITPIVDLTNITNAGNILDQIFGPRKVDLTANGNQYPVQSVPSNNQNTPEYKAPDLSWIQQSIANLGAQITAVGTKISQMQIVLDTGGLVGAVTDGVNHELGTKTIMRRRKN